MREKPWQTRLLLFFASCSRGRLVRCSLGEGG